jgi:hypothetical protein
MVVSSLRLTRTRPVFRHRFGLTPFFGKECQQQQRIVARRSESATQAVVAAEAAVTIAALVLQS